MSHDDITARAFVPGDVTKTLPIPFVRCCKCHHRTRKFTCPKCSHETCSGCREAPRKSMTKKGRQTAVKAAAKYVCPNCCKDPCARYIACPAKQLEMARTYGANEKQLAEQLRKPKAKAASFRTVDVDAWTLSKLSDPKFAAQYWRSRAVGLSGLIKKMYRAGPETKEGAKLVRFVRMGANDIQRLNKLVKP